MLKNIIIHPIFVHFPIALFTIYALLEFLRFKILNQNSHLFYIKATFVIIGSLASFLTLITGVMIQDLFENSPLQKVLELHATMATISVIIFSLIAAVYSISWLNKIGFRIWPLFLNLQKIILQGPIIIILALVGLITITTTGALGGSLVYGPQTDPFTSFVYNLFF